MSSNVRDENLERNWSICDNIIPKEELIYLTQVFLIYMVVISCIINLSFGDSQHSSLWSSLLAGSLGYLLPAPSPAKKKERYNDHPVLSNTP